MNHTIKLRIDNSDTEERDYFEFVSEEPVMDIAPVLNAAIANSENKICAVLSSVSPSDIDRLSGARGSKYLIVPDIKDKNLSPLKGKAIIREMKWNGINLFIIDDACAVITCGGSGIEIRNRDAVAKLYARFLRWFWNNAEFELIDDLAGVDNGIFDAPPVATDGNIISDNDDAVSILTEKCDAASLSGKYHQILDDKVLYFRTVPDLSVLKGRGNESYLVPDLWTSFCVTDGNAYLLNFNPASYPTMPEKGTDRLIGIRSDGLKLGRKYRYCVKGRFADLVGRKLKDSEGKDIEISESASESRKLSLSLKEYLFLKNLENKDTQMLEDRLRSRNPEVVTPHTRARITEFTIDVEIGKHNAKSSKDPIYQVYGVMPETLSRKKEELSKAFAEERMDGQHDDAESIVIPDAFTDSETYNEIVRRLNGLTEQFNSRGGETDDSLAEVVGSKNKQKVKTVSLLKESDAKPLPRFGILYRNKDSYEYVLSDESCLEDAEKEAEQRGWKNITYHIE